MVGFLCKSAKRGGFFGGAGGAGGCGTGLPLPFRCLVGGRGGGGGLPFWSPAIPAFSLIFCPHPPSPLPGGKGETIVISCKGLRPLHPQAEPDGAPEQGSKPRAQWGLVPGRRGGGGCWRCARGACLFGRLLTLPLVYFPAPIPPTPFPSGEGGESRLFHARGSAPCIPGLSQRGRRNRGANHAPSGGLSPGAALAVFRKRARAVAPSIKNREKFWGVWGTLSRVPQRFSRSPRSPRSPRFP